MPELPDLTVYIAAIAERAVGSRLRELRTAGPFVLRTVAPAPSEFADREVLAVRRIGKRIILDFEGDLHAAIHLMISGRLHWRPSAPVRGRKVDLAWFTFDSGVLSLTEASTRKRAAIHLVRGAASLSALDAGGIDPLECTLNEFRRALQSENHTVKRALTDPRILSGVGNAYSDEILHRARMSPFKLTQNLTDAEACELHVATIATLEEWTQRLMTEAKGGFPEHVTAFRDGMAVHGRYGHPCPVCGTPVQRIVYAENESNYCAECQMGGRLLADRALSRLLKTDWPATLAELEEVKRTRRCADSPG